MDQINVRMDDINNACVPFNLTDTYLLCLVSKSIIKQLKNSEINVYVSSSS